jgi:DNA-binding MarR family transcriptional regulator
MSANQFQGFQLADLFREVKSFGERWKKATAVADQKGGISAGGRSILQLLKTHEPLTVPQIARLCSTSRQNIQVAVNRLSATGYVDLISNPAHKRSMLIRMTARGRIMADSGIKTESERLTRVSARISQKEVLAAIAALRRIGQLIAPKLPAEAARGGLRDGELRVERAPDPAGAAQKTRQTIRGSSPRAERGELKPTAATPRESLPAEEEFPLNLL